MNVRLCCDSHLNSHSAKGKVVCTMVVEGTAVGVPKDAPTGGGAKKAECPVSVIAIANEEASVVVFDDEGREGL